MRASPVLLLLPVLLLFAPAARALRCGTDLVREGDPAYRVRNACGEPDWIGNYHRGYGTREEVWHYNFGPNSLMRVMRFREGRLRRIVTAGRGFVETEPGRGCRPLEIVAGMSALELLQRCGDPVQREIIGALDYRGKDHPFEHERPRGFRRVFVEDWYYELGSSYLPRRVRLLDGIVGEIDTVD